MKAGSSSDTSENPKIESNLLLQLQNCDDTLVAGINVVDVSGGPEMAILGFISKTPHKSQFEVIGDKICYKRSEKSMTIVIEIFEKVWYNKLKQNLGKILLDETVYCHDNVYNFFLYSDYSATINSISHNSGHSNVYVICKFWKRASNSFSYPIKTLRELRLVDNNVI